MKRLALLAALTLIVCWVTPGPALARGGGRGYKTGTHSASATRPKSNSAKIGSTVKAPRSKALAGVARDSHGRILRSAQARADFKKQKPCPSTGKASGACPGYVIDHVVPLKRGGRDAPSNMQWQTVREAKAKDKWE
jgi:hypothetical protein